MTPSQFTMMVICRRKRPEFGPTLLSLNPIFFVRLFWANHPKVQYQVGKVVRWKMISTNKMFIKLLSDCREPSWFLFILQSLVLRMTHEKADQWWNGRMETTKYMVHGKVCFSLLINAANWVLHSFVRLANCYQIAGLSLSPAPLRSPGLSQTHPRFPSLTNSYLAYSSYQKV